MKKIHASLCAALIVGSGLAAAQGSSNRGNVLSAPGGRYVFGQVSEYAKDQYLLDTQTGRLWTFITYCEDVNKKETCGKPMLRPVVFDTSDSFQGATTPPPPATNAPLPTKPLKQQ